jgi:glycosyltransferase involved in cell wall biosynthesis
VVDDASTDGSLEIAQKLADDVYQTGNGYYGENDQTLIENAENDYLLLLAGDSILMHDPTGLIEHHTDKIIGVVGRSQHGFRRGGHYFLCQWFTAEQSTWCTNLCCMFNVEKFLEIVSEPRKYLNNNRTWYKDIKQSNDLWFWRFARQVNPEYRPLYIKNAVYCAHIDDNREGNPKYPGVVGGNYGNPHRKHRRWDEWEPS